MPKFSQSSISGLPEAIQNNLNVDAAQDTVDVAHDARLDVLEAATWQNLLGDISVRTSGGTTPTLAVMRGGLYRAWFYALSNEANLDFHLPHDLVPNSDLFLHLHWGHNGTAISGNLVVQLSMTWAKGHNKDIFTAEKTLTKTIPATNLTVAPRFGHIVSEVKISALTPLASQFNSAVFEPDGKLLVNAKVMTNPTITGGSTNTPYWLGFDLHYS